VSDLRSDPPTPELKGNAPSMTIFRRLPVRAAVIGAVLVIIVVAFGAGANAQYLYVGDSALVAAIAAIGLNVLTGTAGQVSIGNAAFLGIGAYSAVLLDNHLPFLLVILIGGIASAIIGLAIGIPSLRLRGLYLVFSTLALQFIASYAFTQYDSDTGAIAGHVISTPKIGSLAISSELQWYVFLLIVLVIIGVVVRSVLSGRPGRAWDAIRANEASAAIIGVDVRRVKLSAFVFSSFIIGVSGVITAYFVQNVSGDYFTLDMAVSYVAMILIGGLGSIGGAIAGAVVVTALPTVTTTISSDLFNASSSTSFVQTNLSAINTGIYGLLVLVFMFTEPRGLAGVARRIEARATRFIDARRGRRHQPKPLGPPGVADDAARSGTRLPAAGSVLPAVTQGPAPQENGL
jgi:branched-chain amino acid transport system permease protein